MTPEAQRIAIAECLGWSFEPWGKNRIRITAPKGHASDRWATNDPDNSITLNLGGASFNDAKLHYSDSCPDYLNDLNAMRDAIVHLREHGDQFQWLQFELELFKVVWGNNDRDFHKLFGLGSCHSYHVTNATAAQRAEAFLRTLNLWRDE